MIQIQWTCPHVDEARKVIRLLLENNLIACANIVPNIESHYRWEGALETSAEIVAFKALAVSNPYEKWALKEVKGV